MALTNVAGNSKEFYHKNNPNTITDLTVINMGFS